MANDPILVSDALLVDGTGAQAFRGSVLVRDGLVASIERDVEREDAGRFDARVVDARGRALAPGFVDAHNHSDLVPFVEPWMDSALRQGCTTLVVGNCGTSPWPAAGADECATMIGVDPGAVSPSWNSFEQLAGALDRCRPSVNLALLVGHGAIRREVMGLARRAPSPAELERMRGLVREAMTAGAVGMSTGLVYVPGMHADTDELAALAGELAPFGGVYASHMRAEGALLFEALDETIEIARRAGVPAHVSHLKLEGELAWGRHQQALEMLADARAEGLDVTADQYPYAAWASVLSAFLPPWATPDALPEILSRPDERARLERVVAGGEPGWQSSVQGVGWDRIVIESHAADPGLGGSSVAEIARDRGSQPDAAAFSLLVADPDTAVIGHAMREEDVRLLLADPNLMVASDASAMSPEGPLGNVPVHPRNYGTFPRVLGHYVREGVLSLESAVRKMTSLPADRFGLRDRGRIELGAVADLVLFDPERVHDSATYEHPHVYPRGIDLVLVAGTVAWDGERRSRQGLVLRGAGGR